MVDAMVTSYTLENLLEDTDYVVRVTARNREGESQPLTSDNIAALKPSSTCARVGMCGCRFSVCECGDACVCACAFGV